MMFPDSNYHQRFFYVFTHWTIKESQLCSFYSHLHACDRSDAACCGSMELPLI